MGEWECSPEANLPPKTKGRKRKLSSEETPPVRTSPVRKAQKVNTSQVEMGTVQIDPKKMAAFESSPEHLKEFQDWANRCQYDCLMCNQVTFTLKSKFVKHIQESHGLSPGQYTDQYDCLMTVKRTVTCLICEKKIINDIKSLSNHFSVTGHPKELTPKKYYVEYIWQGDVTKCIEDGEKPYAEPNGKKQQKTGKSEKPVKTGKVVKAPKSTAKSTAISPLYSREYNTSPKSRSSRLEMRSEKVRSKSASSHINSPRSYKRKKKLARTCGPSFVRSWCPRLLRLSFTPWRGARISIWCQEFTTSSCIRGTTVAYKTWTVIPGL